MNENEVCSDLFLVGKEKNLPDFFRCVYAVKNPFGWWAVYLATAEAEYQPRMHWYTLHRWHVLHPGYWWNRAYMARAWLQYLAMSIKLLGFSRGWKNWKNMLRGALVADKVARP